MPNSNRGMFSRGSGTITVIEEPVMRSYRRKAKIVFYVTWVIIAALTATVAASKWHPILALAAGIAAGLITATITAAIVASWPVIRAIWWWTPETLTTASLVFGWIELADHTTLIWRLVSVVLILGVPAAIRPVRDRLHQVAVVPGHPAPDPDLLLRIHHHQPHRQPAPDLVGGTDPGGGTGVDLAASRPGHR